MSVFPFISKREYKYRKKQRQVPVFLCMSKLYSHVNRIIYEPGATLHVSYVVHFTQVLCMSVVNYQL